MLKKTVQRQSQIWKTTRQWLMMILRDLQPLRKTDRRWLALTGVIVNQLCIFRRQPLTRCLPNTLIKFPFQVWENGNVCSVRSGTQPWSCGVSVVSVQLAKVRWSGGALSAWKGLKKEGTQADFHPKTGLQLPQTETLSSTSQAVCCPRPVQLASSQSGSPSLSLTNL